MEVEQKPTSFPTSFTSDLVRRGGRQGLFKGLALGFFNRLAVKTGSFLFERGVNSVSVFFGAEPAWGTSLREPRVPLDRG